MERNKLQDKMFFESLEKIIFNEEELEELKHIIDRLSKGQCKPIELKQHILNYRADLLERIHHIFQYHRDSFPSGAHITDDQKVHNELEEKNKLLEEKDTLFEELGKKISTICHKLKLQLQN